MAKIYNSELTNEIVRAARIQQNVDEIPSELSNQVVPVMEVNPRLTRTVSIVRSLMASTGTIYTTPTNQDFYLTGSIITGAAVGTQAQLTAVINGATQIINFAEIIEGTGTYVGVVAVTQGNQNCNFPIKIDRGTAIALPNPASCIIYGYIDESSKA